MSNYLIIDSGTKYAAMLYEALTGKAADVQRDIINVSQASDLAAVSRNVAGRVRANPDTTVLVNAEARLSGGHRQAQQPVELVFWLRGRYKLHNTIVFYSVQSTGQLLKAKPENLILLSPGCYHLRLPISKQQLKEIINLKPLKDLNSLKLYLKLRINLRQTRHTYANYAGMNFMSNIAAQVHDSDVSKLLDNRRHQFSEFYRFRNSLEYFILGTYFDLEKIDEIDGETKESLKIDGRISQSKKILLVDDLADKGWSNVISKMIYGTVNDPRFCSIETHVEEGGRKLFDLNRLKQELIEKIGEHKPHLVLLDLRLDKEEGKRALEQLGGYKLLEHIKAHDCFKGVPVVMFTASSNAENVKELLGAGAEAVWTKPGIDEGLSSEAMIGRYLQFASLVISIFSPDYGPLNQINDNYDLNFDINGLDFEYVRNLLFKKLDLIKYRLKLYSGAEVSGVIPEPYKSVDAIYIDANVFLDDHAYSDTICSVYKLALMTADSQFRYRDGTGEVTAPLPKVVVMNSIFDEVIKIAKTSEYRPMAWAKGPAKNELLYLRATLSQLILKQMFTDRLVRTELDRRSSSPQSKLTNPKENVYADGYILDEVADLLVTHASKKLSFCHDTRIVFITGDNKLRRKLERFGDRRRNNLVLKTREEFVADMLGIVM
jgi:CheY-like chemotaxis protein